MIPAALPVMRVPIASALALPALWELLDRRYPRLLPAFDLPLFLDAFRAKPPMTRLGERKPVSIVLNRQTGLLGAAVYAATLLK